MRLLQLLLQALCRSCLDTVHHVSLMLYPASDRASHSFILSLIACLSDAPGAQQTIAASGSKLGPVRLFGMASGAALQPFSLQQAAQQLHVERSQWHLARPVQPGKRQVPPLHIRACMAVLVKSAAANIDHKGSHALPRMNCRHALPHHRHSTAQVAALQCLQVGAVARLLSHAIAA